MADNPFPYTLDNKRYHTWNYHMRGTFGRKVMKISLDAGFTCPNIDGTRGRGGCVYCSPAGSGDFAGDAAIDTAAQFDQVRMRIGGKWPGAAYIAYFQAHTNTYAPPAALRRRFEPVLALDDVVGIAIATRADCLPDAVVDYLGALSRRTWLLVELGLQSVHDGTARRINRCHSYAEFLEGYTKLRKAGLRVCVHLINGLPGEDRAMMLESARQVGKLRPHSVKLHMLHILRRTAAEALYARGEWPMLTREEYVRIVCEQLELFAAETVIQRLTGDGAAADLLAPLWTANKMTVLNEIDKELIRRDSFQGLRFDGEARPEPPWRTGM